MTRSQAPRYHFNPRSREGSDCIRQLKFLATVKFQSTLPRRERRFFPKVLFLHFYFNPRSREGSDIKPSASPTDNDISIHAPAKGATNLYSARVLLLPLFQSTLPRRERHNNNRISISFCDFNPRSREGSDIISDFFPKNIFISIHAPAKGATYAHGMDKF